MNVFLRSGLLAILAAVFALCLSVPGAIAQQSDRNDATAEAVPAEEPAAEERPAFPAALAEMAMPPDELDLRLLPLTVPELSALAAAWQERAQEAQVAVVEAQIAVNAAVDGAGVTNERDTLIAASEARNDVFDRFALVVGALAAKGGDEAEVTGYRSWRAAIAVEEKQQADAVTLARQARDWLISPDGGQQLVLRVGIIVGSLFGLFVIARIVRGWVRRTLRRVPDLSKLLQSFLALVVYWITVAIGLMVVLSGLGVDITPIFALVGGASFIIAFAMQDTLGNLAAGLMIMINHPFDEGDYVTVAGVGGTVQRVSVVATTVTTPDNQVIVIPNSKVWGDVITNVTASETRRVDLVFGIGYDDSIEDAQAVFEKVVGAHPAVLSDPAPVIRVNSLGASSVDFVVRPWVRASDYWGVYWDLTEQIKLALDAKGISIPYPQTDVHLQVTNAIPKEMTEPNA